MRQGAWDSRAPRYAGRAVTCVPIVFLCIFNSLHIIAMAALRSIFGVDPLDEISSYVADWIWKHGEGVPDLEVCFFF